ncbi:hypothetical protein BOTBODRAFT_168457, partial [Botryobasidium botryosum FD-172 SS1]
MSIPLSRETVRAKAAKIRGDGTVPSNSWFKRYVRRNSDTLVFKKPSGLDPKRAKGFNRPTVEAHLAEFETMLREFEIPWENVYNMDEKGIQLGGGRKGSQRKFLFSREQRERYKIKSDDLELVTVIEAVCADGMAPIKPGFVLQGGDLGEWWAVPGVGSVAITDNGWTSNWVCEKWFIEVFIPQAQARNTSGKPIVLLYDGHGSHVTDEMMDAAFEHKIFLFCLPPKTTHKLQPLDVGVFHPIQTAWEKQSELRAVQGRPISRATVVEEYMKIRDEGMKEGTITQAWRRSAHRPVDPDIFTDDDYGPSKISSIRAQVPHSYPE